MLGTSELGLGDQRYEPSVIFVTAPTGPFVIIKYLV